MEPRTRKRQRHELEESKHMQMESSITTPLTASKRTRQQTETAEQLQFLQRDVQVELFPRKRKNAKRVPEYPIIIRKVQRSLDEHRRVIWLRFGSLESMDRVWHRAVEVREITGISTSAQYKIIKRWLQHGKQVISLKSLRGRKIKVPEEQRALIASPEWLMNQRHLSLEQRAAFWREELGYEKLSSWSIRQFYLEHGATYRKPQIIYCSKAEREFELKPQPLSLIHT